jgi:histidine phosphotransferase ChpT
VTVKVAGAADAPTFTLRSVGPSARVPPAFEKLVPGDIADVTIDAQAVQAYYTGALARASDMAIAAKLDGSDVEIVASPVA